jgi:hypothetical protein
MFLSVNGTAQSYCGIPELTVILDVVVASGQWQRLGRRRLTRFPHVDVHKHSLTAVAVDETGRMLDEKTVAAADELLAWAGGLDRSGCGRWRIAGS